MRLSDIISNMELAIWPQVGLIIFFAVFCAVVIRVVRHKRSDINYLASLPLVDDDATEQQEAHS